MLVASGASIVTGSLMSTPAGAATTITVSNLNATGPNSLYDAINNAVDGDTINFQSGLTGTITLTKDLPTINDDITIQGPGAGVITIDGQNKYHPFEFEQDGAAAISGLTVTHGHSNDANSDDSGGAISLYENGGTLTVSNMVLTANYAKNDGGAVWCDDGGGLTIVSSTLSGNEAYYGGGGLYADSCGDITVVSSTISGNTSGDDGGGLYISDSNLLVRNTTISGNTVTVDGDDDGGGLNISNGSSYTAVIANSTISGNSASLYAGAIDDDGGELTLVQTTITGNTAGNVGGIYASEAGLLAVAHHDDTGGSTEAEKTAKAARKASRVGAQAVDDLHIVGTILAGNSDTDGPLDLKGGEVSGAPIGVIDSDHSLLGVVDPDTVVHDDGGTLLGVDPMLGPLADNGGPTMTHALLAGSPAINAGPQPLPDFEGNEFDQRGPDFARVVDGVVDIGAFEVQPVVVRFTG